MKDEPTRLLNKIRNLSANRKDYSVFRFPNRNTNGTYMPERIGAHLVLHDKAIRSGFGKSITGKQVKLVVVPVFDTASERPSGLAVIKVFFDATTLQGVIIRIQ